MHICIKLSQRHKIQTPCNCSITSDTNKVLFVKNRTGVPDIQSGQSSRPTGFKVGN